jgi:hypothetical protein
MIGPSDTAIRQILHEVEVVHMDYIYLNSDTVYRQGWLLVASGKKESRTRSFVRKSEIWSDF